MRNWHELNQEDKNEVVCKAFEWRQEHAPHVDRLKSETKTQIPPSGSDLLHPELWKAAHWVWFDRGGE